MQCCSKVVFHVVLIDFYVMGLQCRFSPCLSVLGRVILDQTVIVLLCNKVLTVFHLYLSVEIFSLQGCISKVTRFVCFKVLFLLLTLSNFVFACLLTIVLCMYYVSF